MQQEPNKIALIEIEQALEIKTANAEGQKDRRSNNYKKTQL